MDEDSIGQGRVGLRHSRDSMSTFPQRSAYHHAFTFSAFGYGCAMTFVLVLIGSVVSLLYWRMFRFTRQLQTPPIENG